MANDRQTKIIRCLEFELLAQPIKIYVSSAVSKKEMKSKWSSDAISEPQLISFLTIFRLLKIIDDRHECFKWNKFGKTDLVFKISFQWMNVDIRNGMKTHLFCIYMAWFLTEWKNWIWVEKHLSWQRRNLSSSYASIKFISTFRNDEQFKYLICKTIEIQQKLKRFVSVMPLIFGLILNLKFPQILCSNCFSFARVKTIWTKVQRSF